MKKLFYVLLFLLLFFSSFSVSVSAEERDDKLNKIEEYMEKSLDYYNIPGASMTIVKNGKSILNNQWGVSSDGSFVEADTPFLIGSLSKPITSLAIMMLVEDGKIKLDEPIQSYLPSFNYESEGSKQITVLHLLEQTSGINKFEGLEVTDEVRSNEDAINEAVKELSGVTLSHEPGENYEYNSANYLLLGAIIEEVTNQTYSDFLSMRIFTPLEMNQSAGNYRGVLEKGYVPGFASWFGKPVKSDGFYDNAGSPYGYIASSSNDMGEFLKFMLDGGDILSDEYLHILKTPPEEVEEYGLGWRYSSEGNFLFHGGATPHFRTEMFFLPKENIGVVLLTNKYNFTEDAQVSNIMKGIRSILFGIEPEKLPAQKYNIQWIILTITLLFVILTVIHFFSIGRRKRLKNKINIVFGIILLLFAIGLIPLFIYLMGTPWKTVRLFAPDIAFLIHCLIATLSINGVTFFISTYKNKVV